MSGDDWFRNKTWNPRIEKAFFEKLSRARSQRDQYLAIQAIEIAPHKPKTALKLIDHYFETRKNDFDYVRVLMAKVDAQMALNNEVEAISVYKEILEREAEFPNTKTNAYVDYPYLVATRKYEDEYDSALEILETRKDDLVWPVSRFKWHASYALILFHRGNNSKAKEHAVLATESARAKRSPFRYHRGLGLVGKEHKPVVKLLIRMATE
jgi:tetratricopeptide (TPR) repeat protein